MTAAGGPQALFSSAISRFDNRLRCLRFGCRLSLGARRFHKLFRVDPASAGSPILSKSLDLNLGTGALPFLRIKDIL